MSGKDLLRRLFLLRWPLSAGLIYLVARSLHWSEILPLLRTVNLPLALAAYALTLLFVGLLAFRWRLLLRKAEFEMPLAAIWRLAWAGQFFNSFLPGSIGGDAIKIIELCRRFPAQKLLAAKTIVLDRISALFALASLAGLALLADPAPLRAIHLDQISFGKVVALAAVGALGAIILFVGLKVTGLASPWLLRLREVLTSSGGLRAATVMSFGVHLWNFTTIWILSQALGFSLTWPQTIVMMPVVLMILLLPVTINGHGLREVLLITYFTYYGVHSHTLASVAPKEAAVAFSLLLVTNDLFSCLPGGLLYMIDRKHAHAAADPAAALSPADKTL